MTPRTDTDKHTDATGTASRSRRRWMLAALLAAAVGAGFAHSAQFLPGHHGQRGHGGPLAMSPDALQAHIHQMVEQCAGGADAGRKARLEEIAVGAMTDLRALHAQFGDEHARAHALLLAPRIDRAALEAWRADQLQRVDLMSRRVVAAVQDGAELLTPEQRAQCAGRLRMAMH